MEKLFNNLKIEPNYTTDLENLLANEFSRLKGATYVDHAAAALYSERQLEKTFATLSSSILGNPHSRHLPSDTVTQSIDAVRERIFEHFNTSRNEYSVIFTSGATDAIKVIAENFVWNNRSNSNYSADVYCGAFVYTQENHTSVLGLRESAHAAGAQVHCLPIVDIKENLNSTTTFDSPKMEIKIDDEDCFNSGLFAYSGQCNYSGAKYPLSWIKKVTNGELDSVLDSEPINSGKQRTKQQIKWFVLLDAAGLAATSPLDLSIDKPDFVPISFYKLFGYPSGLGCLLVSRRAQPFLKKKYFGGGVLAVTESRSMMFSLRKNFHERFEDGTVPFLSICALEHGFNTLSRITGGMQHIEQHVFNVARYFHHCLKSMRHDTGLPVAEIYEESPIWGLSTNGPIVNFNLLNSDGSYIGYSQVERVSSLYNIYLRTGCVCNPGACQRFLNISPERLMSHFDAGHVCGDALDLINGEPTGSIRVSFGYMSVYKDSERVLQMIKECFVTGSLILDTSWLSGEGVVDAATAKVQHELPPLSSESIKGKPDSSKPPSIERMMFLTHILLYPVKSCSAMVVSRWMMDEFGLAFDRQWMIVTSAGVTVTLKRVPKLTFIKPFIDLEKQVLRLNYEGMDPIEVGLHPSGAAPRSEAAVCGGRVCGDRIKGIDCGTDVSKWLSKALALDDLILLRQDVSLKRQSKITKAASAANHNLSLANESQYLILHRESLRNLLSHINERGLETLDEEDLMLRFRANLVLDGGDESQAYEENDWKRIAIGDKEFEVLGPCVRCQMICVAPRTGERTREPMLTLAATRGSRMTFGMYCYHNIQQGGTGESSIHTNMTVRIST